MPLFEIAIIEKPSKKEAEDGAVERLVLGPVAVLAKNDQAAVIAAILGRTSSDTPLDLNKVEVLVRPFA